MDDAIARAAAEYTEKVLGKEGFHYNIFLCILKGRMEECPY